MRINSIKPFYVRPILPSKPGFRGNFKIDDDIRYAPALSTGQILNPGCKTIFNRNTTCYFRNDLNWLEFGNYIDEKFSECDKVNTYIWGCSDGHEAYSIAILTDTMKDGSKYSPIKAMDIMPEIIKGNKTIQKSNILVTSFEYNKMVLALGRKRISKALEHLSLRIAGMVKIKDEIKNNVEFSCSNIVTDMDKIDNSAPSIVMCRNMWPYIDSKMYDECAKKMYDKLSKGSIVVLGTFDLSGDYRILGSDNFPDSLEYAGFKPVDRAQGMLEKYKGYPTKPVLIFEKP